jgi:hypothetical protein
VETLPEYINVSIVVGCVIQDKSANRCFRNAVFAQDLFYNSSNILPCVRTFQLAKGKKNEVYSISSTHKVAYYGCEGEMIVGSP